jgi:DNA-binding CsgD family transcriptional regulator
MFELSVDAFFGMDFILMQRWGARGLETARALDDRPLMAATAAIASFAGTLQPETIGAARAHHLEAARLMDELSDDELARQLNAAAWLTPCEFYLDMYAQGIAHAERGLAVARATGQGEFFPMLVQALANMLFASGRPRESAELLDGAVESSRLSDNPVGLAWSLLNRSFCAVCAGEPEEAIRTGSEAVALTEGLEDSPVGAWAGAVYGRALMAAGDLESAYEVLKRAGDGIELPRIPGPWRAIWLDVATNCCLAVDRVDEARRTAALCQKLAARYGLPLCNAVAHRAAASVALHAGDPATAAERALAAAAGAEEVGARLEAATARELAGRALAELGETDSAATEFERSASEREACGAPRLRQRVERELRKLGRGVHRRSEPARAEAGGGVQSLTGRELEVARLVVDRRTNPEIAAELFLSIKTVESHLRNIFHKLDVSSRVEVARALEQAGSG